MPFHVAPSRAMISFSLRVLIARSTVFVDTPMEAAISDTVILLFDIHFTEIKIAALLTEVSSAVVFASSEF